MKDSPAKKRMEHTTRKEGVEGVKLEVVWPPL